MSVIRDNLQSDGMDPEVAAQAAPVATAQMLLGLVEKRVSFLRGSLQTKEGRKKLKEFYILWNKKERRAEDLLPEAVHLLVSDHLQGKISLEVVSQILDEVPLQWRAEFEEKGLLPQVQVMIAVD